MVAVKGIYKNGDIRLLEPVEEKEAYIVEVTFIEPVKTERQKKVDKILSYAGMWEDMSEQEFKKIESVYQNRDKFFKGRL